MVRFTTKKIATLTLGEKMRKIREERRMTLVEVSKNTHIQCKYLQYLEDGEYSKLPADVYVRGFLRSYAQFMGISESALLKQYDREKGIQQNIKKIDESQENVARHKPVQYSSFVITPKMIIAGVVVLAIGFSFFYLYQQVNNFVSVPRLVIMKPMDGISVDGKTVHVVGVAEKDALVSINDQSVLVNANGEFSEDVGIAGGLNTITVRAKNRFEKEAVKIIKVNGNFETVMSDGNATPQIDNAENPQSFTLELFVSPNPTWLSVEVDDNNLVFSGVLNPQETKTFTVNGKAKITTSKGNGTFVKIDGKDIGMVSNEPGVIKDVVFNALGRVVEN